MLGLSTGGYSVVMLGLMVLSCSHPSVKSSIIQMDSLIKLMLHSDCRVVPIGEASVIIAVSSAHRKNSLEAVQYCIDTLKATVPIWKKV